MNNKKILEELRKEVWEIFNNKKINSNAYLVGYNSAILDIDKLIKQKINQDNENTTL